MLPRNRLPGIPDVNDRDRGAVNKTMHHVSISIHMQSSADSCLLGSLHATYVLTYLSPALKPPFSTSADISHFLVLVGVHLPSRAFLLHASLLCSLISCLCLLARVDRYKELDPEHLHGQKGMDSLLTSTGMEICGSPYTTYDTM